MVYRQKQIGLPRIGQFGAPAQADLFVGRAGERHLHPCRLQRRHQLGAESIVVANFVDAADSQRTALLGVVAGVDHDHKGLVVVLRWGGRSTG
jgi:hypothetical protein